MTGSARQSYYEIALTSRQVMTVFVVLLVAVLAAFLSGVWVGRKGSAPKVEMVEAQAIEAAGEPGDSPLERLDFFNRNGSAAEAPAAESPPPPADPAAEAAPPEAPADPPPTVARVETPAVAAQPPAPKPAVVAEPAPPVADTQRVEAPAPAASTGNLVVQVFSSNNQVQAQSVVDRLRSGGYPALLSPVEVSGRTMYRVRIGPYGDRKIAEGIAEQVRNKFRLETWITE